jgi:hypothetical protein
MVTFVQIFKTLKQFCGSLYDIKNIKDELKNKLGFTTVIFFLQVLYTTNREYPGSH